MSTWIHCNHYFIVPIKDYNKMRFWFTSCGHLLCAECLKAKRSNNNNGQHFECLLCHQQNVQLVELNRHLRPELLALFRPAKDLIDEFNAKLKQVLTFQQSHQKRLVDHLTDKKDMQKMSAERDKLKLDLEQSNEKSRKTEEMLANTRHELQRLANKFHQQHHRGNHHQRRTRPLSSSVANFATPATVAGIPSARRPSSVAAHSVALPFPSAHRRRFVLQHFARQQRLLLLSVAGHALLQSFNGQQHAQCAAAPSRAHYQRAHCAALFHHSQRTRQHRNRFVWLLISVQKTK
ncbi:hypothetical protein niasHT_009374 [Heterodera trifolii]|uniref:RING-type domain-containing protein n=1 Tax=Heterodera trifolii TaxID=157864 RepID=A0ABD2M3S5_9BILA